MSETLRLTIDSSGAKRGADEFNAAVRSMSGSLDSLDKSGAQITKLNQAMNRLDFRKVANGLSAINGVVNATTITNLNKLGTAIQNIRIPTNTQVGNLRSFGIALGNIRVPPGNLAGLNSLLGAISRFNPPNAATSAHLQSFATALRSIGSTGAATNIRLMATEMNALAVATIRAANAYRQLNSAQGNRYARPIGPPLAPNAPQPYQPNPRYTSQRVQSTTGMSAARGPYDGIFSGQTRATGELRGLENVMNPAYQGASLLRTAVGAITLGSFVKEIYEASIGFTRIHHMLEVMAKDGAQTEAWMQRVADISEKFGLDLATTRKGFASFSISAMQSGWSEDQAISTFTNLSSAIRALGLDSMKAQQIFHAFETAISTGAVTATQLHRQLIGIPGITPIMARIVWNDEHGKPLSDPLDQKTLLQAEQNLTNITRKRQLSPFALGYLAEETARLKQGGLPTAINSVESEQIRMQNTWTTTKESMAKVINPAFITFFQKVNEVMKGGDTQGLFTRIAQGIADAIIAITGAIPFFVKNMENITTAFKIFMGVGALEVMLRLGGAFRSVGSLVAMMTIPLLAATRAMWGMVAASTALAARGIVGIGSGAASAVGAIGARGAATTAALSARVGGIMGGAAVAGGAASLAGGAAAAAAPSAGAAAVGASATAAGAGLTALGVVGTVAFAALAAAGVVAAGTIWQAWDKTVQIGEQTVTVGDMAKSAMTKAAEAIWNGFKDAFDYIIPSWDRMKESAAYIASFFSKDLSDSILGLKTSIGDMAMMFLDKILAIAEAIGGLIGMVGALGSAMGSALTFNFNEAWGTINGQWNKAWGNTMNAWNGGWRTQAAIQVGNSSEAATSGRGTDTDGRRDRSSYEGQISGRRDRGSYDTRSGVANVTPFPDGSNIRMPGHGGSGDGGLRNMQGQWDTLRESVSGYDKAILEYQKDMAVLNYATQHFNVTQEERIRIEAAVKDKILETLGASDPSVKATAKMEKAVGALNAMERLGIITADEKAKHLRTVTEVYEKAAQPVEHFLKQMGQEVALLRLGSKEREVQARLLQEVEKMRLAGKEPSSSEVEQMKTMLELEQKMKEVSADREHGLQNWANGFRSLYTELAKFEEKLADDMSNAMADFITTGKTDFKSMVDGWYKDIMRLVTHDVFRQLLQGMGLTGAMGTSAPGTSLIGGAMGLSSPTQNMNGLVATGMAQLQAAGASPATIAAVQAGNMSMIGGMTQARVDAAMAASSGDVSSGRPIIKGGQAVPGLSLGIPLPPPAETVPFSFQDTSGFDNIGMSIASGGMFPNGLPTPPIPSFDLPFPPIPPDYSAGNTIDNVTGAASTYGLNNGTMIPGASKSGGLQALAMGGIGSLFSAGGGGGSFLTGNATAGGGGLMGALFGKGGANMFGLTDPQGAFMQNGGLLGYLTGGMGAGMKDAGGYGLFNDIAKLFGGGASAAAPAAGTGLDALIESGTMTSSLATDATAGGLLGAFGGSGGGIFGGMLDGIMKLFSGLFSEGGYSTDAVKMGMFPATAFSNAPHYAQGTNNTSFGAGGMPAVVHPNEAIIPLSRGRKIPVELNQNNGGQGAGVNVTMNITTPDADSFRASQGQIYKDAGTAMSRHMRRN